MEGDGGRRPRQEDLYAYDTDGNKGVGFGLQNLQFLGHGEKLAGAQSAESQFGPVNDDGEDLDGAFNQARSATNDNASNDNRKSAQQYARDLVG